MIKIAFYIGKPDGVYEWLVRRLTGKRTHCELVLPDRSQGASNGLWISSSPRDGGVRAKRIDPEPGHWEIYEVPYMTEHAVLRFVRPEMGCKYDWSGVLLGWLGIQSKTRWFCSEFCAAALTAGGRLGLKQLCTPEQLYQQLRKYEALQEVPA